MEIRNMIIDTANKRGHVVWVVLFYRDQAMVDNLRQTKPPITTTAIKKLLGHFFEDDLPKKKISENKISERYFSE